MKAESARMGKNFLTIDQAIARLIKRTGDDFTWRDLFKKSFNGEIVLHLKIDEVPVRVNLYSEDCVTIECFSGYIDTSLTDDGLEYIKALYNGKEGLGIGSFIDDDQRHYHVADLDELTEDDEFSWMKGLDCRYFKDMKCKFPYVPDGYYKPKYPDTAYEEFYVESFRVDCLIDGINYKNGSGYSFQYVSQLWGYDRRKWGALSDTTEIECIRKGFKQRRDARIFGDSNEPDSSIIQWVVDELDALIKQPDTTIQKILLTVPVTTQETSRFACNPFYHLKIQRRSSQARTRTERLESLKRRFREDFREFLPEVIPPEKLETTNAAIPLTKAPELVTACFRAYRAGNKNQPPDPDTAEQLIKYAVSKGVNVEGYQNLTDSGGDYNKRKIIWTGGSVGWNRFKAAFSKIQKRNQT